MAAIIRYIQQVPVFAWMITQVGTMAADTVGNPPIARKLYEPA